MKVKVPLCILVFSFLPINHTIARSEVDQALGRTGELFGCVATGIGATVFASLAAASAYGTYSLAKVTGKSMTKLGSEETSVAQVCGQMALTGLLFSVSSFLSGIACETAAYSWSFLRSTERPQIDLLSFAGAAFLEIGKNMPTKKVNEHHHYYHRR